MSELQNVLNCAERLLEGVRSPVRSECFDFEGCLNELTENVTFLKDPDATFRLTEVLNSLRGPAYVLRNHPNDQGLREHVVVPPFEKLVVAVKREIFRAGSEGSASTGGPGATDFLQ